MRKRICAAVILLSFPVTLFAEGYQYQYFAKPDGKVPFSDYIPRVRLHYQTVPHYVEDYYELYGLKMYYNEKDLRVSIERLKTALTCKFRHPSQALVKVESEQEYEKYRKLMFMHINMLIMRNYLMIGARYDKQHIYFYNQDFAKEITESLDIASQYYNDALPYWEEAKKYAAEASRIKITTQLSSMETERYRIISKNLDYDKIIATYKHKIEKKKDTLASNSAR